MKAIMITLAAIFSLTMNVLFAGNYTPELNNEIVASYNMLAPATPAEASFEEVIFSDFTALAPVAPMTADFSDSPETASDLTSLAPVTPEEADFSAEEVQTSTVSLEPATPAAADFTDTL